MRLILDYNATLANTSLVDLQTNLGGFDGGPIASAKQFTTDVLFTYLLHPGSSVYVGYNNGYTDLTLRPGPSGSLQAMGAPNNSTSRLLFIKLSYLFRF